MAANIALKRFKKAQKRKQVVAEKRKLEELEASLPAVVRRAAATPIQHCLLTRALFEGGAGTLFLARGPTPDRMTLGLFLIDAFCLGIKDAVVRMIGSEELEATVEAMEGTVPLVPVDPSYARKLVREAAAWAQSIGFPPHRNFAVAEQLFGDIDANACDANFQFGQDGKPFYIPGPSESPPSFAAAWRN